MLLQLSGRLLLLFWLIQFVFLLFLRLRLLWLLLELLPILVSTLTLMLTHIDVEISPIEGTFSRFLQKGLKYLAVHTGLPLFMETTILLFLLLQTPFLLLKTSAQRP